MKAHANALCTNIYPAPDKIEGWITHHQLQARCCGDAVFLLRRNRDFWHLYFCARDLEALRRGLAELHKIKSMPVVCDLIGNARSLARIAAALGEAGLRPYKELVRMARTTPQQPTTGAGACCPQLVPPKNGEGKALLELIEGACDRFAKQIPALEEIEAASSSRQILTFRCGETLAGLLHYETRGVTTTLRYWVVAPGFRDRGVGSALMNHYLASQAGVRRFVLWVNSDNEDALRKYRHYHYARDGVVDLVLVNDWIAR